MTITQSAPAVADGQLYIDGGSSPSQDGRTTADINPATEEPICQIAAGTTADIDRAIAAARRAQDEWAALTPTERSQIMVRAAGLVRSGAEDLALRESLDVGKPIRYARDFDVPSAADLIAYYGGLAEQLEGAARPVGQSSFAYTRREPVGVVGAITPFNFPLNLAINKIAPALAAGNTVVHKPAEETPLSALRIAEIITEAGAPAGVYNVVTGDGPTLGNALVEHPGVDKLAFTGSTAVGQQLIAKAAGTLKKVTVELGGKGAEIVFPDADLEIAAQTAFQAGFFNSGQFCMAGSRLLVHRDVYDEMAERMVALARSARIGDPQDPDTDLGPLAHRDQLEKVRKYVQIGVSEGATLLTGGHDGPGERGYFHEPTIFGDVEPGMRVAQEEIFGPVLVMLPFASDDEAVAIANGTPYGLAAGLHTTNLARAHKVAARLQAGMVWVNTWGLFGNNTPFGGYKASGYGRELGPEGIEEYLQYKTVYVNVD